MLNFNIYLYYYYYYYYYFLNNHIKNLIYIYIFILIFYRLPFKLQNFEGCKWNKLNKSLLEKPHCVLQLYYIL